MDFEGEYRTAPEKQIKAADELFNPADELFNPWGRSKLAAADTAP
jgi:hypothetical protein